MFSDLREEQQNIIRELEQANKENERLRKINHELAEEHKTIGQDLYAEIKKYRKEKENLKEENEKLKKILQELEDLSLKTYDVAGFQMYFDNLRGKNDD